MFRTNLGLKRRIFLFLEGVTEVDPAILIYSGLTSTVNLLGQINDISIQLDLVYGIKVWTICVDVPPSSPELIKKFFVRGKEKSLLQESSLERTFFQQGYGPAVSSPKDDRIFKWPFQEKSFFGLVCTR